MADSYSRCTYLQFSFIFLIYLLLVLRCQIIIFEYTYLPLFQWKGGAAELQLDGGLGECQGWDSLPRRRHEGVFYRWWLPSCVLVELIVLMMRFNCSINHVLEHQEHCEGVFLVTISVERRKLNNGII